MDTGRISTEIYNDNLERKSLNLRVTEKQKEMLKLGGVGLGGMITGAGLFSLFGSALKEDGSEVLPENSEMAEQVVMETSLPFAESINDQMEFQEAFAAAREEVGAGGFFTWKGNTYNTYYKEEWDGMSEEDQEAYASNVTSQSEFIDMNEELLADNDSVEGGIDDTNNEVELTPENEFTFGTGDINGNGIVDAVAIDEDNDGYADVIVLDINEDGIPDAKGLDLDQDGDIDVFVVDEGQDGFDVDDSIYNYDGVVSMDEFIVVDEDEEPIEEDTEVTAFDELENDLESDLESDDLGFDDVDLIEI